MIIPFIFYKKNRKLKINFNPPALNHLIVPGLLITVGLFLAFMFVLAKTTWKILPFEENFPQSLAQTLAEQFSLALILLALTFLIISFQLWKKKNVSHK